MKRPGPRLMEQRAAISLRLDFGGRRIGPGKVALLEAIAREGSISAAARSLKMSYRRAWMLVEELNSAFATPAVTAVAGGNRGGGAALTPLGQDIIARFRAVEEAAAQAAKPHLEALLEAVSRHEQEG